MSSPAPSPAAPAAAAISQTGDLVPRLNRLLRERGISRSQVCLYLGLHTNTLQRIHDPAWHPRLDTLLKIEGFLNRFEHAPFVTSGAGWALSHTGHNGFWQIQRHGDNALGPFHDADEALAAGAAIN